MASLRAADAFRDRQRADGTDRGTHDRSSSQFVGEQDHFLKISGQPPCASLRSFVQYRKERFAEIPCALERPEPSRLNAAPGPHELAGALQRPPLITWRDLNIQGLQVQNISLPVHTVFLPAADITAIRADLPRIFLDERRGLDQESLEPFCGQNADIYHGMRKKMFPSDRRDMMRIRNMLIFLKSPEDRAVVGCLRARFRAFQASHAAGGMREKDTSGDLVIP